MMIIPAGGTAMQSWQALPCLVMVAAYIGPICRAGVTDAGLVVYGCAGCLLQAASMQPQRSHWKACDCSSGDFCAAGSAIAATEEPELVAPENDDRAAAKLAAAQQKEQQQHHQVRFMRSCSVSIWCCSAAQAAQPASSCLVLTEAQQMRLWSGSLSGMLHQAARCLITLANDVCTRQPWAAASQGLTKACTCKSLPCRCP